MLLVLVGTPVTSLLRCCSHSAKLLSLVLNIARSSSSYLQHLVQMNALNLINHLLKKVSAGLLIWAAGIITRGDYALSLGFPLTPLL